MSRLPSLGPRGEGWLAGQMVLFSVIAAAGVAGRGTWDGPPRAVTSGLGIAALLAGGLLAFRGVVDLRENLTPLPAPVEHGRLVDTGAYSIVRHPIYSGLILAAFGWGLVLAAPAAFVAALVLGVFFDLKSRREEAWLAEKYPGYAAYRSRTRKLVPGIY